MDWTTIHAYAEEAELWTTLALNVWVICGGIAFMVIWAYRRSSSLQTNIVSSVIVGFVCLCLSGGGVLNYFWLRWPEAEQRVWSMSQTIQFVLLGIAITVVAIWGRWKRNRDRVEFEAYLERLRRGGSN